MKIEPVTSPTHVVEQNTGAKAASTRDRAVAAFLASQPEQKIVQNASAVSPEELSAVTPPKAVEEPKNEAAEEPKEASSTEQVDEQKNIDEDSPKEVTKEEPPLSAQYAQLARKEKALRAQVQQMKAKEAELAAREAALQPKQAEPSKQAFDPSKYISIDELKNAPYKRLTELGVTYDQLTQEALNGPSQESIQMNNYIKQLESKLSALEEKQNNTLKSLEEQQTTAYKQTIASITREVDKLVSSDAAYETISATSSTKAVVDLIEKTYKEDGVVLDIEEAAQLVEDHLAEKYTKIASIKKIQQRMQAAQAANASKNPAPKQAETPKSPKQTLSNNMAASRPLTARERALLAFENKLNKS